MSKIRSKKAIAATIAAMLALGCAAGGSLAYLTDSEQHTNTFTAGDVQIDLEEPNYAQLTDAQRENMVPNQVIAKDPKIENTSVNDAIVFMKVTVPVKEVTLIGEDGSKGTKKKQEIFYLKKSDAGQGTYANSFNDGWVELPDKESGTDLTGDTRTYVFAYNKKLEGSANDGNGVQDDGNKVTSNLFDKIQLKNVIEKELTKGETENIVVEAYAIQASDVMENGVAMSTSGTIATEDLGKIYGKFIKQGTNGSEAAGNAVPEAQDNNAKNLRGNGDAGTPNVPVTPDP